MNAIATVPLVVEDAASEFLRKNNLEADFQRVCELARECYPEIRHQRVELRDDVDEPDLQYVLISSELPKDHPIDLCSRQTDEYHRRLNAELPSGIWISVKHRPRRAVE